MNFIRTSFLICFSLICFRSNIHGQSHRFSGWFQTSNNFELGKKWELQFENQFRSDNHWKNAEIVESRVGLSYELSKKLTTASGYSFIENWKTVGGVHDNIVEHRLWSQLSYETENNSSTYKQRIRVEERFLPVIGITDNHFFRKGDQDCTRFRYMAKWVKWFKYTNHQELGFYAVLQNEMFMTINGCKYVNNKLFDQFRGFGGLGYKFNDHIGIEPGYLLQYVIGTGKNYTINNVFQLSLNMEL